MARWWNGRHLKWFDPTPGMGNSIPGLNKQREPMSGSSPDPCLHNSTIFGSYVDYGTVAQLVEAVGLSPT